MVFTNTFGLRYAQTRAQHILMDCWTTRSAKHTYQADTGQTYCTVLTGQRSGKAMPLPRHDQSKLCIPGTGRHARLVPGMHSSQEKAARDSLLFLKGHENGRLTARWRTDLSLRCILSFLGIPVLTNLRQDILAWTSSRTFGLVTKPRSLSGASNLYRLQFWV